MKIITVICCAVFVCLISFDCAGQSRQLPRVGTIKDYPATGLMTGCGNLYFFPVGKVRAADDAYVFIARGDGNDAWMNLAGRDVRLQQIKLLLSEGRTQRRFYYRSGKVRISVVIESFKPKNAPVEESDSMFKMKITLRRGRAVRIVRAVGDADC